MSDTATEINDKTHVMEILTRMRNKVRTFMYFKDLISFLKYW